MHSIHHACILLLGALSGENTLCPSKKMNPAPGRSSQLQCFLVRENGYVSRKGTDPDLSWQILGAGKLAGDDELKIRTPWVLKRAPSTSMFAIIDLFQF